MVRSPSHSKAKNRSRNITWFHPPYSKHVATNVGKKFLSIVNDCFRQDHPLRKIFNKNTLKISYSCMLNLEAKITNHNKAILANSSRTNNDEINQCNCRNKSECPLDGYCLTNNVIYQATVVLDKSTETYIGLTENHFKTRYRNHLASFKDKNKNATHLSRYIWTLNEKNIDYDLK